MRQVADKAQAFCGSAAEVSGCALATPVLKTQAMNETAHPLLRSLRLTGQPVTRADAPFYAELFSKPEVVAFRPDPTPLDRAACETRLEFDVAHWQAHGFGRWGLHHAGHPVGLGGLTLREGFDGLNLSYHLLPAQWGLGLASEFVTAALDYAALTRPQKSIFGLVRPLNAPSIRVLEKAGFKEVRRFEDKGAPMMEMRLELR